MNPRLKGLDWRTTLLNPLRVYVGKNRGDDADVMPIAQRLNRQTVLTCAS
ncbi:hypothetical protein [Laspinema palackyanum]|nr:hypothetical protein [Laspinema sp. D2c]